MNKNKKISFWKIFHHWCKSVVTPPNIAAAIAYTGIILLAVIILVIMVYVVVLFSAHMAYLTGNNLWFWGYAVEYGLLFIGAGLYKWYQIARNRYISDHPELCEDTANN